MSSSPCHRPRGEKSGQREFLGAEGFYCIWIPGFSAIARHLYDLLGGPDQKPPAWTEKAEAAFTDIKTALGWGPALGLPNIEKPFNLFVLEKRKIALGVFTQTVGPW